MSRRRWLGAAVSLVAILGAAAHLVWPGLRIDAITVLLLVVALVPWLGDLLESIELPGGWKVKYRDLQERQDALERTTEEASSTARAALGAVRGEDLPPTMETVRRFAEEYRLLRKTPRQPSRTAELDQLFGTMVTVLPRVPGFDPVRAFDDDEDGIRLAGYAALYGRPDPAVLEETARALGRETTGFIQYWGIRTVAAMLDRADPAEVSEEVFEILQELLSRLPRTTSRHEQLGRLLGARRYG